MGKRGGPQPGSGRPKGRHNKCTTLTLPIPAYNELMSRAQKAGSTVSQYIIDELNLPRTENVENAYSIKEDFGLLAAEEITAYETRGDGNGNRK